MMEVAKFLRPHRVWKLEHKIDATATKGMILRQGAGQMKHLSIKELWIQEAVQDHKIRVIKIPREENPADALASPARSEQEWTDKVCSMNFCTGFPLKTPRGGSGF